MVYGMARQSGGTARIESTPGEGTTVKLSSAADGARRRGCSRAPTRPTAPDAGAGAAVHPGDRRRPRRARLHRREPRRAGLRRAPGRATAREGLEAIARERPDLVVLDFIMPGLSGAEVASRILAEVPRPADPVRLRLQRDRGDPNAAPGAPVLAKPFRADALDKAVRAALAPRN